MANHGVSTEGKRLPRMAATLMMRFASEREPTFGIHRASLRPLTPNSEIEDSRSAGEESQSTNPELHNLYDAEEPSSVGHQTQEVQSLDSPPQMEDLGSASDITSLSGWSLSSVTAPEATVDLLEDTTDDSLTRDQRTGGTPTVDFTLCLLLLLFKTLFVLTVKFADWHKNRVTALCTGRFDKLLRECPEYHSAKSCFAAFVLERGECEIRLYC